MSLSDIVSENFKTLVALGGGAWLAVDRGVLELPDAPDSMGLFILAGVALGVAGWVVGGKIDDLLPEPEGVYLVCLESNDETGGEVWNLTDDQFADMEVHEGSLFQWPVPGKVYECYHYNEETNVAVSGWRESPAASELSGGIDIEEAYAAIDELREEYEPAQRKLSRIKRRLRAIARRMDRRRAMDQNAMLDPELSPTFEDDEATVSDILREELPDHLQPEAMREDSDDDGDGLEAEQNGEGEFAGFEILDDQEPLAND